MTKGNLNQARLMFITTAFFMTSFVIGCGTRPSKQSAKSAPQSPSGKTTSTPSPENSPVSKNSIGMEFKPLTGGTFTMGKGSDAQQVTLTTPFEMGVHEVTQQQYELVMGKNPSLFKGAQNPVERVRWKDAVEFCRKLSALTDEKASGGNYRLPTAAEWEYACRAGTTTAFCFGDDESGLGDYSWYNENSSNRSHPVGEKKPNQWSLCDMHGNVSEWCQDDFLSAKRGSVTDPTRPKSGSYRMCRGGSYSDTGENCESSSGYWNIPTNLSTGFRVVRVPNSKQAIEK